MYVLSLLEETSLLFIFFTILWSFFLKTDIKEKMF